MTQRKTIGGPLRYDLLAALNRPQDTAALCAEARRLAGTGLTAGDIASAMRIDFVQVRRWLGEPSRRPLDAGLK